MSGEALSLFSEVVRAYHLAGVSAEILGCLLMGKTVLGEWCRSHSGWRQSRSLAADFIATTINFLLGSFQLHADISQHLKWGRWDTKRVGLLHQSDCQDPCRDFGSHSDKTEVPLVVGIVLCDYVHSLFTGNLCWPKKRTSCLMSVEF